jgi:two-component system cell cycle sensor histidine kinase/response regulator CckA
MLEQTRETILVVDDEPITRRWVSSVLLDEGYTVLLACDGEDALNIANGLPGKSIDLLVTDIHMPRMDGPELSRHIRRMQPGIKVLFISSEPVPRLVLRIIGGEFLEKTFEPVSIAAKVRDVLDQPATT